MKKSICILVILSITKISFAQHYWTTPTGIREIPLITLNDIACATYDQYGPVIYYNPNIVYQVGPLVTAFFQAHEYGHHALGHVTAQLYNPYNPYVQVWLTFYAENEADAYSVNYHTLLGNKIVLQAAYNHFINNPNNGDKTHAPSSVRAQNIASLYFQLTGTALFP